MGHGVAHKENKRRTKYLQGWGRRLSTNIQREYSMYDNTWTIELPPPPPPCVCRFESCALFLPNLCALSSSSLYASLPAWASLLEGDFLGHLKLRNGLLDRPRPLMEPPLALLAPLVLELALPRRPETVSFCVRFQSRFLVIYSFECVEEVDWGFIEERRLTWEKKNICEVRKITKKWQQNKKHIKVQWKGPSIWASNRKLVHAINGKRAITDLSQ